MDRGWQDFEYLLEKAQIVYNRTLVKIHVCVASVSGEGVGLLD